jgi:hypothetical protein
LKEASDRPTRNRKRRAQETTPRALRKSINTFVKSGLFHRSASKLIVVTAPSNEHSPFDAGLNAVAPDISPAQKIIVGGTAVGI